MNEGDDAKQLATDTKEREETEDELKATEEFLETTTEACKAKADEWAERSRLRTEELAGMNEAIDILTSDEASATFATATAGFVQLSEERRTHAVLARTVRKVKADTSATPVSALETKAQAGKNPHHFIEVEKDIKTMIGDLREEENEDIKKKAWCDNERRENFNHQEGLEFDIDAVMLLAKTIEALSKYATNNKLGLLQKKHQKRQPEYTTSEDTAPEATFSSASSGASETGGIVGIIENIKQDLEEEMDKAKQDEAEALQAYKQLLKESQESLAAMKAKIASMEVEIAETTKLVADKQQTW